MSPDAVEWAVTLLLSVVGGLVARWVAPHVRRTAIAAWRLLRTVRAYVLGVVFGVSLATGAFLADDVPWDLLVPVARRLAVVAIVTWFAKNLLHLRRVTHRQLRLLESMSEPTATPDGGRVDDPADTSGTGLLGGAIAGGYLGAGFGPQGAVFGAVVGAALGDELERDSLEGARE